MAQSVIVKNKEIRVKNPQMVVEDENRAELIEFTITNAYSIEDVEGMIFYVQYRNKLGEVGMDTLVNAYPSEIVHNDMLVLDWLPSASFTKERGKIEIQIVGFTESLVVTSDPTYQSGKLYFSDSTGTFIPVYPATSTHSPKVGDAITGTVYENQVTGSDHRWSTEKCILLLPENIHDNGTPIYTEAQVKSLITQIQEELSYAGTNALRAEGFAIGEQNGTDVGSDSPYYHNNAKYYNEQAEEAESSASDSATEANAYKIDAENARDKAEEWATKTNGKIDNIDYSAKHYAGEARDYAQDADNARIDSVTETISPYDGGTNTIIITYKDGTTKTFTVTNGHTGEAFYVFKTYSSIYAMEADLANVPKGKFVLIASNVIDPDNAKLYYRNDSAFQFITDLSGATGAGIPAGGTTGQVVRKKSNTDYELEWSDEQDISGKFDKSDIAQNLGNQTDKVPSNAAVNSAINTLNTRVTNIEDTLMGENEVTVQYPDDGNYSSLMPNRVPLRALKFAEIPTIKGKTRAWNQMIPALTASNFTTGGTYYSTLSNDSDGNLVATSYNGIDITCDCPFVADRKYLLVVRLKVSISGTIAFFADSTNLWTPDIASADTYYNLTTILSPNANTSKFRIVKGMSEGGTITVNEWFVRDVTSILSDWSASDITTANIPLMVQQIPDILKSDAYDAGSLVDTELSGARSVGVNIWDEEWENKALNGADGTKYSYPNSICSKNPVKVFPNTSYYFKVASNSRDRNLLLCEYSADGTYLGYYIPTINNPTYTTRIDTAYIQFYWDTSDNVGEYDHTFQICLNSLPDAIKTTYHPYKTDTLSLPETVTLRSAGAVSDELDVGTGIMTRNVGYVDLSTLTWTLETSNLYSTPASNILGVHEYSPKWLCDKYLIGNTNDFSGWNNRVSETIGWLSTYDRVICKTDSTPTGHLVFELATPTTESIDPVPNNFIEVEGGGAVETIQTQTPVIDNCLDVTYDIIPQ